ncbi:MULTISPECIES: DUF2986 domain-containing protein [Shewanella]|uniref:DUF2986 domain-containing protein n=1 Tax=Shewanella TaxID=22 RepID=UPI001C6581B0|nr:MULTISPECIES: DUF2986 domain-containing protein [Shewanella]QYJ73909.1 DUF2986 domain-containing protein [Shewanella sp. FJAT-52076]QYK03786.1 DUF2986 domain-containing protein [Shewanella zhangzhouensis]
MNRRQALIKKMAKRTKARENKKEKPNAGAAKDRYISKAERAKLEAEAQATEAKLADASSSEMEIGADVADIAADTGN